MNFASAPNPKDGFGDGPLEQSKGRLCTIFRIHHPEKKRGKKKKGKIYIEKIATWVILR